MTIGNSITIQLGLYVWVFIQVRSVTHYSAKDPAIKVQNV